MSKKQIAKLLLALGIGVATAASGAAFIGCGNGDDNGDNTDITQPGDDTDGGNTDGGNTDGGNTDGGNEDENKEEYEDVTTNVPLGDLWDLFGNGSKIPEDYTVGAVTFEAGVYFDSTSGIDGKTVNNQKKKIWFNLQGTVNSIKFDAKGGSSFTLILYKENGTVVKDFGTITSAQLNLKAENLEAGKYYLLSEDGSGRLGNISYTQKLQKGTPASIEVKASNVDFLLNRTFSTTGVSATVTYTNGGTRAVSLTSANFNYSQVDMTKAGTYTVNVSYTENDETVNGSYSVNVYEVETIELGTFTTSGNVQTTFNQVYKIGATFSTAGLTVVASAKCGTETKQFVLNADEYTTSTPNLSAAGTVNFTVTAADKVMGVNAAAQATLPITVVGNATVENNTITLSVDAGKVVSETNFHTLTDAIAYLGQLNLDSSVVKVINIADGEYNEKVYINIPNVQLIGSDTVKPDHEHDNGVVIVYDALAGATDAAGHTYGTNGSATVTIGAGATGFIAKNITFKNYYNTFELYSQSKAAMSDTQAVALLVESTKASFIGCKLTSYHDTLYSNKGNHYYEKCWIEGHTDYIFGQDARAYFYDCDIYSIGAGVDEKNGGYVTALKPSSASADYYFVYNNCRFDADENTKDGSIALGRAWGADMKMVVMNSSISAKFSTAAHTAGTGNSERYCTMSGNEPKPANMLEYNNRGEGAIDASINNTCTVLTDATAYDIANLEAIIGWNPNANFYTITIHYEDKTFTFSAEEGKVITLEQIKAALGSSYSNYTITGVYTDEVCESAYDYEPVNSTVDIYVTLEANSTNPDIGSDAIQAADFFAANGNINAGTKVVDGDLFTVTTGSNALKGVEAAASSPYAGKTVTAPDGETELDFSKWMASNSNGAGYGFSITTKAKITLTIYYTFADSSMNDSNKGASPAYKKNNWVITGDMDLTTDEIQTSISGGYQTLKLDLEQGWTISFDVASGNRWVVFAMFAQTVGEGTETDPVTNEIISADQSGVTNLNGQTITGKAIKVAGTGGSYNSTPCAAGTVTANDDSGLTFTNGWFGGGGGRTINVTALKDTTITLYYTISNGDYSSANPATSKSRTLSWTINGGASVTSENTANKFTNVAYAETIELKEGDVCTFAVSGDRLIVFAVVAE